MREHKKRKIYAHPLSNSNVNSSSSLVTQFMIIHDTMRKLLTMIYKLKCVTGKGCYKLFGDKLIRDYVCSPNRGIIR